MKRTLLSMAALACMIGLAACGGSGDGQSFLDSQRASAPEAVELFESKARCISCHGTDLEGRMGEQTNIRRIGSELTKEQIMTVIRDGKGLMNGFEAYLEPEEIETIADWLVTLK